MSCLSHDCLDCKHAWEDNIQAITCPKCGSWSVSNHFDEYEPEPDDEDLRVEDR